MSLYEHIEPEAIDMEEENAPRHSGDWGGKPFTVQYQRWKALLILLCSFILLPIASAIAEEGLFFQALLFGAFVALVWGLADCLLTSEVTFSSERIVKKGLLGEKVVPTREVMTTVNEQTIRFFHGTVKNLRESVTVWRFMITTQDSTDIINYAASASFKWHPAGREGKGGTAGLALMEFHKTVTSYRIMAGWFVLYAIVAVFVAGLTDEEFFGLAPELPAFAIRISCIALAIAVFFLLRRFTPTVAGAETARKTPVMQRLGKIDGRAFLCAIVACFAGFPGLVLFLFFGNMLDLYVFLLVGFLYFYDCHPRLSTWEQTVQGGTPQGRTEERAALPRRSLQVSLVLMGALAVMSYGEDSRYLYASRKDCLDDWGDGKDCQEAPAGTTHYGSGRYYGPRYGSSWGRGTRSLGVARVSRGGFGSLGGFHASFGG